MNPVIKRKNSFLVKYSTSPKTLNWEFTIFFHLLLVIAVDVLPLLESTLLDISFSLFERLSALNGVSFGTMDEESCSTTDKWFLGFSSATSVESESKVTSLEKDIPNKSSSSFDELLNRKPDMTRRVTVEVFNPASTRV
jgi:hypothetical protein